MAKSEIDEDEIIEQMTSEIQSEMLKNAQFTDPPQEYSKDNQYKFLRELLMTKDSTKIANFSSEELGKSDLSMRGALKVALLCDTMGLQSLGDCYRQEGEILASTSMSRYQKSANFLTLIFTQIRKAISGTEPRPEKKGWFNNKGES